jgi:hypothetical protein
VNLTGIVTLGSQIHFDSIPVELQEKLRGTFKQQIRIERFEESSNPTAVGVAFNNCGEILPSILTI